MRILFYQTQEQATEAKNDFINSFEGVGVTIKHSSFTDRSNYECCDDFTENLSWSGENSCEVVEIYNSETFEDIEVCAFASWE